MCVRCSLILTWLMASLAQAECRIDTPGLTPDVARPVSGNRLISPKLPEMLFEVVPELRYAGCNEYVLKNVARVQRHHFVATKNGRVVRTLIFQFESFLKGVDDEYRWAITNPVRIGGLDFRQSAFFYDQEQSARENPGLEPDRTVSFLKAQGLAPEPEVGLARLATILGTDRRSELLVFYQESLSLHGIRLAETQIAGNPKPAAILKELQQKILKSFEARPISR